MPDAPADRERAEASVRAEIRASLGREDAEYLHDFYTRHKNATIVMDTRTGLPVEAVYDSAYKERLETIKPIADLLVAIRAARDPHA